MITNIRAGVCTNGGLGLICLHFRMHFFRSVFTRLNLTEEEEKTFPMMSCNLISTTGESQIRLPSHPTNEAKNRLETDQLPFM